MTYQHIFKSAVDGKFYGANGDPDRDRHLFEAAGIIKPDDIKAIDTVAVLDGVFGLARPQYVLRQACRAVRMDALTASIDVATAFSGKEKVEPLEEADIVAQAYTRTNFDLWKNVVHVVAADESVKKASHDIMALQIADAARELARMENSQIKTILEAGTHTSAGADWGTAVNPYNDIMTAFGSIEGDHGFEPTHVVAHPYVWMDFFGNSFVKGTLQGEVLPAGKTFSVPGLPGINGISDWQLTSTIALIVSLSAPAAVLGDGPVEAARYRNEKAGYDAHIIRQWLEPKIVLDGAIYRLTGVHA